MGKSLLIVSVLAAVVILIAGFMLVLEESNAEAAVIGLLDQSRAVECPGRELLLVWGEFDTFTVGGTEHEIGVLRIIASADGSPQVTLRVDGEITDRLTAGRNVKLASGTSLIFLGIHEGSGEVRLCAIPFE